MSVALPIEEDPRFRRYTASAGQTVFPIPFPFQQEEDVSIQLFRDGKYTEIDRASFSIAGEMNPSGGAVTFNAGRVAGDVIVVVGAAILERLSSIVRDGRFASKLTDDELDRNRIIQQEQQRDISRSLKAAYGSEGATLEAASPSSLLHLNEGGNIVSSETPINEKTLRENGDLAIASLVGQAGPIEVPFYDTRLAVTFASIKPTINAIRTGGYSEPGDGGTALYKRTSSEPINSGKVQSADGAWWELADLQENAAQVGSVGDNATINTSSFNSYRADALSKDGRLFVPRGTFRVADAFNVQGLDIEIQPGASLVNEAGSIWGGSMDGIDMGGSSASPISSERAFGDLRGNTRITAPGMIYVVDGDGVDPTGPIHTNVAFFRRGYRGRISNSYTVAQNVEAYVSYGRGMAFGTRASGSMRVIGQRMQVFSAENGDTGVTELQAAAHSVRFNHDGDIANGLNIWIRETTGSGKVSSNSNDYDKYLAGDTIFVQKYNPGRTQAASAAGDTYIGAFGAVITTHPQPGGFNGGMPLTQPTYPLDALLALSGYTGPNWSSAYSGHAAQATSGAFFALTIGGNQGGVWTGSNRSRFDRGVFVTDCIYDGMVIDGAHPLKDATFSAIRTTANSGRVLLGLDSSAVTNSRVVIGSPSGSTDDAIRIVGSSHATSERASINYNNRFVVGVDLAGTGANVFTVYDATNAKTVLGVSALGELYLPSLPTSADGTRVWKDTNGFLKVG